jgi:hypothetical protein
MRLSGGVEKEVGGRGGGGGVMMCIGVIFYIREGF